MECQLILKQLSSGKRKITMKLKIQAQHLQPGDIVGSGEKVINIVRRSIRMSSSKVAVMLKKDGHQRTVQWGKYTEINIERPAKPVQAIDSWSDGSVM